MDILLPPLNITFILKKYTVVLCTFDKKDSIVFYQCELKLKLF
jgi:hypothetical protein